LPSDRSSITASLRIRHGESPLYVESQPEAKRHSNGSNAATIKAVMASTDRTNQYKKISVEGKEKMRRQTEDEYFYRN
jgi:hypothetical protein